MRIALLMEATTAEKNEVVANALNEIAANTGHTIDNYGQYSKDGFQVTTITNSILGSALIECGAADFIVTGCGTGMGNNMCLDAMPNLVSGVASTPYEMAILLQNVNVNCVAMAYSKGYGWAGEINVYDVMDVLLKYLSNPSMDSPEVEKLKSIKKAASKDIATIIREADPALIKQAFGGPNTMKYLDKNCTDGGRLSKIIHEIIDK